MPWHLLGMLRAFHGLEHAALSATLSLFPGQREREREIKKERDEEREREIDRERERGRERE